jgi:hypothetical protein
VGHAPLQRALVLGGERREGVQVAEQERLAQVTDRVERPLDRHVVLRGAAEVYQGGDPLHEGVGPGEGVVGGGQDLVEQHARLGGAAAFLQLAGLLEGFGLVGDPVEPTHASLLTPGRPPVPRGPSRRPATQ